MHPTLIKAAASGKSLAAEVEQTARYLADLMVMIHGGDWSVDIHHDVQFISIARNFNNRCAKPLPEVA